MLFTAIWSPSPPLAVRTSLKATHRRHRLHQKNLHLRNTNRSGGASYGMSLMPDRLFLGWIRIFDDFLRYFLWNFDRRLRIIAPAARGLAMPLNSKCIGSVWLKIWCSFVRQAWLALFCRVRFFLFLRRRTRYVGNGPFRFLHLLVVACLFGFYLYIVWWSWPESTNDVNIS